MKTFHEVFIVDIAIFNLNVASFFKNTSVNWQDSNIMVKSIDQSPKSCGYMIQSRAQSTVQSSPESRHCRDPKKFVAAHITLNFKYTQTVDS